MVAIAPKPSKVSGIKPQLKTQLKKTTKKPNKKTAQKNELDSRALAKSPDQKSEKKKKDPLFLWLAFEALFNSLAFLRFG
jgi:hypothetical protein